MSLLTAENLSFSYPLDEGKKLDIFHNWNLKVQEGEILCLLGPSGCGKSTVLKLLAGFLAPSSGSVFYRDNPVRAPFKMGQMIFQDPSQLLPWLTVRENVLFPNIRRMPARRRKATLRKEPDEQLQQILGLSGMEEYGDFYPSQLSGGMKQRCALARSLYANPEILFMDEPFVSLDAPSRNSLQKLVLKLWEEKKKTILFVTHDIAEALLLADRLMILSTLNGAVKIQENPLSRPRRRQNPDFLKQEARLYSYLESSEMTL
ncbi:MAG: hypothetical protein B6241_05015 [Spirochaetaceae bacterium 4572_59]|nr:MAG: hypothetical protein B6241_05015 [Spirochaetaceae bacterium 4572_59]